MKNQKKIKSLFKRKRESIIKNNKKYKNEKYLKKNRSSIGLYKKHKIILNPKKKRKKRKKM